MDGVSPSAWNSGPHTSCSSDRALSTLALYRLERQGFIKSSGNVTENNRRARYYALTAAGRRHFDAEITHWRRLSRAVNLILATGV
jgi:DNA-binding MarR family transcriptional regulator